MTDDRAAQTAPVLLHVEGGVATVTLNRPEAMNSLDLATKDLLVPTIRQVADDPAVRVVVITGSGRAFCVGQDLKEHIAGLMAGDEGLGVTVVKHYNPIAEMLATMNKPVIAALNGVAAGAGASIAMAADFRIMVEGGGMNLAFAGIALSCDTGSSFWLPRLVGVAKAKELPFSPGPSRRRSAWTSAWSPASSRPTPSPARSPRWPANSPPGRPWPTARCVRRSPSARPTPSPSRWRSRAI